MEELSGRAPEASTKINTETLKTDLESIFGTDYEKKDVAGRIYVYVKETTGGEKELHCMKKGFINWIRLKVFHKEECSLEKGSDLRKILNVSDYATFSTDTEYRMNGCN